MRFRSRENGHGRGEGGEQRLYDLSISDFYAQKISCQQLNNLEIFVLSGVVDFYFQTLFSVDEFNRWRYSIVCGAYHDS